MGSQGLSPLSPTGSSVGHTGVLGWGETQLSRFPGPLLSPSRHPHSFQCWKEPRCPGPPPLTHEIHCPSENPAGKTMGCSMTLP